MSISPYGTIPSQLLNLDAITRELHASRKILAGKASKRVTAAQNRMLKIAGEARSSVPRSEKLTLAQRKLAKALLLKNAIAPKHTCSRLAEEVVRIATDWSTGVFKTGPEISYEDNYKVVVSLGPDHLVRASITLMDELFMETLVADDSLGKPLESADQGKKSLMIGPHIVGEGLTIRMETVRAHHELIEREHRLYAYLGPHPFLSQYYPKEIDYPSKETSLVLKRYPTTLSDQFAKGDPLTDAQLLQLVDGVAYLHDRGVAVNALEASSIFLDERRALKLGNLGACIAPSVIPEYKPQHLKQLETPLSIVSPEALSLYFSLPSRTIDTLPLVGEDPRMEYCKGQDAFALGLLLFKSLTGPLEQDLITSLYPDTLFELSNRLLNTSKRGEQARIRQEGSLLTTELATAYSTWWQQQMNNPNLQPLEKIVLGLLHPNLQRRLSVKVAAAQIRAIVESTDQIVPT